MKNSNPKYSSKKALSLCVVFSIFTSACGATTAELATGGVLGAGVGAGAGAVIAKQIERGDVVASAALGAALGAATGASIAMYNAYQENKKVNENDAEIKKLNRSIQDQQEDINNLRLSLQDEVATLPQYDSTSSTHIYHTPSIGYIRTGR